MVFGVCVCKCMCSLSLSLSSFLDKTWWKWVCRRAQKGLDTLFSTDMDTCRMRNKLTIQQTFVNCVDIFWYMNRYSTLHSMHRMLTNEKKNPFYETKKINRSDGKRDRQMDRKKTGNDKKKKNLICDNDIVNSVRKRQNELKVSQMFSLKKREEKFIVIAMRCIANKYEEKMKNTSNIEGILQRIQG